METWLKDRLSICLDFEVPDELLQLILELKTSEEVDNYFSSLLDNELPEHRLFINDFKQRFFGRNKVGFALQKPLTNNTHDSPPPPPIHKNQPDEVDKSSPPQKPAASTGATKKKPKYTNLYAGDGRLNDTIMLKGRNRCDCQAGKHRLVNNCMRCGRIVCEQEGSGPCLFCGELVCSQEEYKMIRSSSKRGDNLKKTLLDLNRPRGWEEALLQRNRLLEFERTSEQRTTVIDDESDYFKTNSVWLSDNERKKLARLEEELHAKRYSSRLTRKLKIDFSGREIVEEPQITIEYEDNILKEIAKSCDKNLYSNNTGATKKNPKKLQLSVDIHPALETPAPIFIPMNSINQLKHHSHGDEYDGTYNRVQDKQLLEIQDMRHCISLHQPWASLMVTGIKIHEGRSWYTAHRGRLWIASTCRLVLPEEIETMQQFYKTFYSDPNLTFPAQYPGGVLLGCVSVQDCLPQEQYRKEYPNGESESPFVFICSNPQELPIKFPVKGEHKIYKLDKNIHVAAIKSLQRIAKLKADDQL